MSRAPKARSCYICGRQYMVHSFAIHEAQCRAMFEKWENQKLAKDRRKCPEDPMRGYNPNMSMKELDKLNADSQQVWSEQALVRCQNCNRTFLPEKLPIHQRSCTASNPARRVDAPNRDARIEDNSMSGSIRAQGSGKFNAFDENEQVNMNSGNLMQCQNCGRSFNAIPYSKHIKVCAKVFTKSRKVFNSAKQRMQGTELEQFNKQSMRGSKASSLGASKRPAGLTSTSGAGATAGSVQRAGEMPKWKQDSLRFRDAMKAAREVSRAEKKSKETGIPLHLLLPAGPSGGGRGGAGARAGRQEWDDGGYGDGGGGSSGAYQEAGALQCPTCGRTFSQKAGERHIPQCRNIIAKPSRLNRHSGAPSYSTMSAESTGRQLGTFGSVGARMTPSTGTMGGSGGGGMGGGGGGGGGGFGNANGGGGGSMQRPPMSGGRSSTLASSAASAASSNLRQNVRQSSTLPSSRPGSAGLRGAGATAVGSTYASRPSPRPSEPLSRGGSGFGGGASGRGPADNGSRGASGGGSGGIGGGGGYRISQSNATSSANPLMGGRW